VPLERLSNPGHSAADDGRDLRTWDIQLVELFGEGGTACRPRDLVGWWWTR